MHKKGLNLGGDSAAQINKWLKQTEHQLVLYFQSKEEDEADIPSIDKTLHQLFEVIQTTSYDIQLNRDAFRLLMKLAMNEKTKDWVDGYLSKSKVVIKIRDHLETLLTQFLKSHNPPIKSSKTPYDDDYDDYEEEIDQTKKGSSKNYDDDLDEDEDDYNNINDKMLGYRMSNEEKKKRIE